MRLLPTRNCRRFHYPLSVALLAISLGPLKTAQAEIDLSLFSDHALVEQPQLVACTLTTGEEAECARLVVKYKPDNLDIGPFCPETVTDQGGVWAWDGKDAGLYRLNTAFFDMLASLGLDFSDDDQHINISDPGAGRPTSDHACLEASEDSSVEMTVLIPTNAKKAQQPTDLGTVAKVGLAVDGVPIFADAPSVLQTGHLPALDTCGGHIDPGGWYHWHGTATDINTVFKHAHVDADCVLPQQSSALFGYAFDGYAMYGSTELDGSVPDDLDACNGHVGVTARSPEGEYHYHSTDSFPNLPSCLSGLQAQDNFSTTASNGIGSQRGSAEGGPAGDGQRMPPGMDKAAQTLGVTEQELMQALRSSGTGRPDLEKTAATLGVSVQQLRSALPRPEKR